MDDEYLLCDLRNKATEIGRTNFFGGAVAREAEIEKWARGERERKRGLVDVAIGRKQSRNRTGLTLFERRSPEEREKSPQPYG